MIAGQGGFASLAFEAVEPHRAPAMPRSPLTPEELFTHLDALGIAHKTYSHPPVFTVAEAAALRGSLPGGHCKSLFLKDKKGGFWLAVMLEERRIDLKKLAAWLAAPRFSFGGTTDLYRVLGCGRAASPPSPLSMIEGAWLPRCSMLRCWSTIRSTIIHWKTIAPPRSRPPICCT
jgi:hypothetical protein